MTKSVTDGKSWHKTHPLIFNVLIALLSTALISLAVSIFGSWTHIFQSLRLFGNWLSGPVATPRWIFGLLLLCGGFLFTAFAVILSAALFGKRTANPPSYYAYLEDHFFGVVWRWRWNGQEPVDCLAFCPVCDLQITPIFDSGGVLGTTSSVTYDCKSCQKSWHVEHGTNPSMMQRDVSLLVQRNARRQIFNHAKTP